MNKQFYVVVLPMDLKGAINKQIYGFTDLASAKQAFHANCGKYFNTDNHIKASVCLMDEDCRTVVSDLWDSGREPEVTE